MLQQQNVCTGILNAGCTVQGSSYDDMMTPTCCQDHILTENIWFVWSKTSNCGDKVEMLSMQDNERTNIQDRAYQPKWMLEAEFQTTTKTTTTKN